MTVALVLTNATVELKVHVLLFRFSFRLRCICSLRSELSQFGGHNNFHPVHQISTFEYLIESTFVPVSGRTTPRPSHRQRIRFGHGGGGWMVVTLQRVQSLNPIASSLFPILPPNSDRSTVMPKPPLGPSRLSQILQKLKADPKPVLTPSLRSLKLTYAPRNNHFGARCVRRYPTTSWLLVCMLIPTCCMILRLGILGIL